jgi:tetratricopeptide (TPR) repeat protein
MTTLGPEISAKWENHPFGPSLSKIVKNVDYKTHTETWSDDDLEAFSADFMAALPPQAFDDFDFFAKVLEELTLMKLSKPVIHLCESHQHHPIEADFRTLLFLASAYMIENELQRAATLYLAAHRLEPNEAAPAINLAKIFYKLGDFDASLEWAFKALELVPNHAHVWRTVADVFAETGRDASELYDQAVLLNSFIGVSLYAHLAFGDDAIKKAELYDDVYNKGERDANFLIDYTGTLGAAGRLPEVVTVTTEAIKRNENAWQLFLHAAQASLSMGDEPTGMSFLDMAKKNGAPAEIVASLED